MIPSALITSQFPIPPPSSIHISNPNPNFSSHQPPIRFLCRCRRGAGSGWDSNAESVRTPRFRFRDEEEGGEFRERSGSSRRWWSDESADGFGDEFDPFEEESENIWDKIWIFKVFKGYGYMLPAIIASMLLATGPKAFLMALALPLGQSAISLAVEKLWGGVSGRPRTKPKARRRPFVRSSSKPRRREEEEEEEEEEMSRDNKARNGYQSWVSRDPNVADNRASSSRKSTFGGWDELDNANGSMRTQSRSTDPSAQAETMKKGKLSKRGSYRDAPLFLRLLIAVFPFLGSWTRIL